MRESLILQGITTEELTNQIKEALQPQLQQLADNLKPPPTNEYLTRNELKEMLSVSFPTIHDWIKKGKLTAYRIGNRTYFKRTEVEKSFKQITY